MNHAWLEALVLNIVGGALAASGWELAKSIWRRLQRGGVRKFFGTDFWTYGGILVYPAFELRPECVVAVTDLRPDYPFRKPGTTGGYQMRLGQIEVNA